MIAAVVQVRTQTVADYKKQKTTPVELSGVFYWHLLRFRFHPSHQQW